MKLDTTLNHIHRFKTRIYDSLSEHWNHDTALKIVSEKVYTDPAFKKLPYWAKRELYTVFSERIESAHRYGAIRWALWTDENGKHVEGWDNLPESIRQEFRDNKRVGFHYWTKTGTRF